MYEHTLMYEHTPMYEHIPMYEHTPMQCYSRTVTSDLTFCFVFHQRLGVALV